MKRNIIIGVLLILLVIVVGVVLATRVTQDALTTGDTNQNREAQLENNVPPKETDEEVRGKGSLLGLLAMGRSQECTFVVRTDGMVQEGTAFYDGGNARVDTLIKDADAGEMASYMIMDKNTNTMYMWGSAQGDQGIKMTLPTETSAPTTDRADVPSNPNTPSVTPDMDVDYNCKPWRVDGSVFVPPTDIEFMDMSEMQKMMGGMGGMMPRQ